MKVIAIIKRDLRTYTRNRIKLLSLGVAVLLPLAYGYLYLWAFWNPYDNMKNVPVAVVNQDTGALYQGEQHNFGQRIVDELKQNDVLAWRFTTVQDAADGLDRQKYYAIITIPSSFSSDLVSASGDDPHSATISWQTRDSTNFLFTTYFKNVIAALDKKINESVLPEFSTAAQVKLQQATGKLDAASSGANQLSEGLDKLAQGSSTLTNGLQQAQSGAQQLTSGLGQLDSKSSQLNGGIDQAQSGAAALETGLTSADSGASSLSSGLGTLSSGATTLKSGSQQMVSGTRQLASGAEEMDSQVKATDASLSPLYPTLEIASDFIDQMNSVQGMTIPNYIASGLTKKDELLSGTSQIKSGSGTIADKMVDLDAGVGSLKSGIQSAQSGAGTLQNGIGQLKDGSTQLHQGLDALYDGSTQYTAGVGSAYQGSQGLTSGIGQLEDGSQQLTNGLQSARSGAGTLSSGLASGSDEIKQQLTPSKISSLLAAVSQPVTIEDASTDTNSTYGAGFAPYFIPLALWMGALILTLLVPTRDPKLNLTGASRLEMTVGKFFLLALVGIAQSLTLCLALIYGLGLSARYPLLLILFSVLISLSFVSIMQFLSFSLGKIGELLGIVLLMVQLTSASGTFPVESAPAFFQFCNPLVPMTYAIRGLRLFILGGNMNIAAEQAAILAAFCLGFLLLKTLLTRRTAKATDIYPLIEL